MQEARLFEYGQSIYIADCEIMPQVEVRTSPIGRKIKRIDERRVASIGRIVYGMAVGISQAQRQIAHIALYSQLQRVVNRIRQIPERVDVVESGERGAYGSNTRNRAARNCKINGHLP